MVYPGWEEYTLWYTGYTPPGYTGLYTTRVVHLPLYTPGYTMHTRRSSVRTQRQCSDEAAREEALGSNLRIIREMRRIVLLFLPKV